MKKSDFNFTLPKELIAQSPLPNRSDSRLMVVEKFSAEGGVPGRFPHRHFYDIGDYIGPKDCLVINNTKVIPARLIGHKISTGAKIEVLLLTQTGEGLWETLVNPGKKVKVGDELAFGNGLLKGKVAELLPGGNRLIQFSFNGIWEEVLDQLGEMPLPPYIQEQLKDKNRYQTVYAKHLGSAAAPTAGLHFTDELLNELAAKGVSIAHITLHVGLGTFRPVKTDNIEEHHMHAEYYQVEETQAELINKCRQQGGRIIGVGTTSCRTLESCTNDLGIVQAGAAETDIFIYPGYRFKAIDALITNFHLPESTLIMMVSALCGKETILKAYAEAVKEKYRFFSFGDAMLIT